MSKLMPRGNVTYPLHAVPGDPLPDVLQVAIASTDDEAVECYSVYRYAGESVAAFVSRAQDTAHEHHARIQFSRGVSLRAAYHLPPDPKRLLDVDYAFNARSQMLHTAQNEKASDTDRVEAALGLARFHGWLEPPTLN